MRKLSKAIGALAAPAVYFAGRAFRWPTLTTYAIDLDAENLRAYRARISSNEHSSEAFERFTCAAKLSALANSPIDSELWQLVPKAHGQLLQDVVCALMHKSKSNGYFVEIGVGDGKAYSNTLLLETELNWTGILAEPATMFHESIAEKRSAILDRRAVSNQTGDILEFVQDGHKGELSGLVTTRSQKIGRKEKVYSVQTVSFDDLLKEYNAPDHIEYVSIDTEGSELLVLDGLSISRRQIDLISIEHNFDKYRMKRYDEFFLSEGYTRILTGVSSFDFWYVHQDFEQDLFST